MFFNTKWVQTCRCVVFKADESGLSDWSLVQLCSLFNLYFILLQHQRFLSCSGIVNFSCPLVLWSLITICVALWVGGTDASLSPSGPP